MLIHRIFIGVCRLIVGFMILGILGVTYRAKFPEFLYLPWSLRGVRGISSELGDPTTRQTLRQDLQHSYIDTRLAQQFPVGSAENKLTWSLWINRFTVDPKSYTFEGRTTHNATLEGGLFPCEYRWFVSWSADDGIITAIHGDFSYSCL